MNKKISVPNSTYFVSLNLERISQSYLLILLNALRKAVIVTKIVLVTIFLSSIF